MHADTLPSAYYKQVLRNLYSDMEHVVCGFVKSCPFFSFSDQLRRSDLHLKDALWREISRLPTIYSVSDENKHERCSQRHWGGKSWMFVRVCAHMCCSEINTMYITDEYVSAFVSSGNRVQTITRDKVF